MRKPNSTAKNTTLWQSTISAASGFVDALKAEAKVRQIFLAMIIVSGVCAFADVGYFQILIVIFSWVVSFICEMFNTALEKALDYACGKEFHPLIKQGKDYAAACTFISLIFAGSLSLFVLWDRHMGITSF